MRCQVLPLCAPSAPINTWDGWIMTLLPSCISASITREHRLHCFQLRRKEVSVSASAAASMLVLLNTGGGKGWTCIRCGVCGCCEGALQGKDVSAPDWGPGSCLGPLQLGLVHLPAHTGELSWRLSIRLQQ